MTKHSRMSPPQYNFTEKHSEMTLFQPDEIIDTRVAEVIVEMKFPRDAPKPLVMKACDALGFHVVLDRHP